MPTRASAEYFAPDAPGDGFPTGTEVAAPAATPSAKPKPFNGIAASTSQPVWGWGGNRYGEIGDGTTVDRSSPVQLLDLTGITALGAGGYHSLGVKNDETLWAWGENDYGQLGDGTTTSSSTPIQVAGISGVKSVAAGWRFSLALKTDGTVWAWGMNEFGTLGNGTNDVFPHTSPVQVTGLTGVTAVAAGAEHALALKSDGTV